MNQLGSSVLKCKSISMIFIHTFQHPTTIAVIINVWCWKISKMVKLQNNSVVRKKLNKVQNYLSFINRWITSCILLWKVMLTCNPRAAFAMTYWAVLVLSKQSTQFVLTTPVCFRPSILLTTQSVSAKTFRH